jgi:DNA-binding response OmpR family regulator
MRTALLISREPCVHSAVCDLITPAGVRIVCARDCARAIAALDGDGLRPRLIVLDLTAAGHEGLAFLRWLREREALRATPVLLLAEQPASSATHDAVVRFGTLGALPTSVEEWRLVKVIDTLSRRSKRSGQERERERVVTRARYARID